jgi:hypothetical protein
VQRRIALWALLVLAPFRAPSLAHGLDIPIHVDGEIDALAPPVVTLGVPLGAGAAIRDVSELGMSGARAAQFRALQRDRDTDTLRWVLVSFLPDPAPAAPMLTRGNGAFGGAALAREDAEAIHIDTGAARFEIRKRRFNFLNRVEHASARDVLPHLGGIVVQADGVRYRSSLDAASQAVIEENGPVRAVVRATGVLCDSSGARHLGFTARLIFEHESAACRAFVTLRNADIAAATPWRFDAAWVELPVQLGAERQVRFGADDGARVFSAPLGPDGQASLFQGDNAQRRHPRTSRIVPHLTPALGFEVVMDGFTYAGLGDRQDAADGWMRLSDGERAVHVAMRDFAPLFPSGLQVTGNVVAVDLFARRNPQPGLVFSWGAHATREIVFAFGDAASDPLQLDARLRAPLVARCSFEHYRDTGSVLGETRLVSAEEQRRFFAELGHAWELRDLRPDEIEVMRQWSFRTTGGWNQFDRDLAYLVDFLRAGQTRRLEQARLGVQWKADQAVSHSDDFDFGERQYRVDDVDVEEPESFLGKGAGNLFDDEHAHWTSMILYYYMTGDERIRDAILDYGEWRLYRAGNPAYGAIHGGALRHFRLWSGAFRDMALLYDFTGEARYLAALRTMARTLVETREENGSRGRSLERGYFYFGKQDDPDRRVHLFFLTEVHPPAVLAAMRALPAHDPLREELRDYLAGLAWFALSEARVAGSERGYPYGYFAARANVEPGERGDQTGILLAHGYEMSGDPRFVEDARDLTWRVLQDQNALRGSELSTHVRIHCWLHRHERGATFLDSVATPNADGSWTLRWKAPHNAAAYIVKYGRRSLVETLEFDQLTRTYTVDPDSAMNFWAAINLPDEPAPAQPYALQTYTTPVLPPGPWHFRVKVLLDEAALHAP